MFKTKVIEETIYKLSDLLDELQMLVRSTFDRSYWVIAEIVSVSEAKNGHLYLEIAEKENDLLQAKIRANIWSNAKKRILSEFEYATNQTLKKGMKVLVNVTIDFHAVFGLSLNILDIDPNFSLGEIERQKQATLLRLEQEGLIDFNKQHVLPPVIQSIAIISSESAAGYQDFMKQLIDNQHNYKFQTSLFQSTMQGETAANSIIQALDEIENAKTYFDIVVLIRGGGSSLDLSCFDEYSLAARIAQSHFPVFTGIGHERDLSIADRVAHTHLKTPTAVAEYIIAHNRSFEDTLDLLGDEINQFASNLIEDSKQDMRQMSRSLHLLAQNKMNRHAQALIHQYHNYQQVVKARIAKEDFGVYKIKLALKHNLKNMLHLFERNHIQILKDLIKQSENMLNKHQEKTQLISKSIKNKSQIHLRTKTQILTQMEHLIQLADPKHILKKGFSITRVNGKLVRRLDDLDEKTILITEICDGKIESILTKTYKNEQENNLQ